MFISEFYRNDLKESDKEKFLLHQLELVLNFVQH